MSEYNNSAVSGGCQYTTLGHYNSGSKGMSPPVPATTTVGVQIVPGYTQPGYDALTHGGPGCCTGYPDIQAAYGKNAQNCSTKYLKKLCQ